MRSTRKKTVSPPPPVLDPARAGGRGATEDRRKSASNAALRSNVLRVPDRFQRSIFICVRGNFQTKFAASKRSFFVLDREGPGSRRSPRPRNESEGARRPLLHARRSALPRFETARQPTKRCRRSGGEWRRDSRGSDFGGGGREGDTGRRRRKWEEHASEDSDDDCGNGGGGRETGRIAALRRIKIRNDGAFQMIFWKGFPIVPNAAANGMSALVSERAMAIECVDVRRCGGEEESCGGTGSGFCVLWCSF